MMKKRILSLLLAVLMVVTLVPTIVLAEKSDTDIAYAVTGGNIYFNKETGTITDCDDTITEAIIPSEIDGVAVTSVGWWAFRNCTSLANVTIPDSVTAIYAYAFSGCTSLDAVVIPNGIELIYSGVFAECTGLTSVTIPSSVTIIDYNAFENCTSLTDVYYSGSEAQWDKIKISYHESESDSAIAPLFNAKIHYNSVAPVDPVDPVDPVNPVTPTGFSDVASGSYCYDAVQWAVGKGITNGTDATHFSPNAGCTRAQVVTFLWRAAGSPDVSTDVNFVDVSASSVYYKAIMWAVANGITKGTDAMHFSPNATCTRGQVVTFMYRTAGEPAVSGAGSFFDVASGSYCYNAVQWAVANGITKGTDATHFSPSDTCTRGQVVTLLYRAQ